MNDRTADVSNTVECHNIYNNGAHKCTIPIVVNELR